MSDETTIEEQGPTPPRDDAMAGINRRLDAQDKTNEAIMTALAKLTAPPASTSAAGSFRGPAPTKEPIVVEEKVKTPEDVFLDKIVDRLQTRLGLAATGIAAPVAEPGGPCNLCEGEGVNAGGVVGCVRCSGSGIMPGRRLS